MTRWKIELRLPILTIGAEDIQIKFRRNRKAAGPYLIISRALRARSRHWESI
jgi:uncharacterized protein YfaS (alpha-2-macroglobulin family)